jgi:hypothetical protein
MTNEPTDETVDQGTIRDSGDEDPRIAVLQAVFDRVDSWQEHAAPETVAKELDEALAKSDIELDDATRQRIIDHISSDASHGDVRDLLG